MKKCFVCNNPIYGKPFTYEVFRDDKTGKMYEIYFCCGEHHLAYTSHAEREKLLAEVREKREKYLTG